jgi:hypothetical protein
METHRLRFPHQTAAVPGTAEQFHWCKNWAAKKIGQRQLVAETEFLDHSLVATGIVSLEVVEQATPLADQHEKTAARAVIFLVHLEVFRQSTNAFAQQSDLDFRATGIGSMGAVLVDEGFLLLSG